MTLVRCTGWDRQWASEEVAAGSGKVRARTLPCALQAVAQVTLGRADGV